MQNFSDALTTATEFYQAHNFFQAKLICYQIIEHSSSDESVQKEALSLLGTISYKLNQNKVAPVDAGLGYHLWYYDNQVWKTTYWAGVRALKSPCDMWNYQEIIFDLKPALIVEFGTYCGGSTSFFSSILSKLGCKSKILSVDISHDLVSDFVKNDPLVELMLASSTAPEVAQKIASLRIEFPGPVFAILDSDHSKHHVLGEMLLLRPLLQSGDYLIVEDSNINGHPVLPDWGEGPYEALTEYFTHYPHDYERDHTREQKFGFTFATEGFLIRI